MLNVLSDTPTTDQKLLSLDSFLLKYAIEVLQNFVY